MKSNPTLLCCSPTAVAHLHLRRLKCFHLDDLNDVVVRSAKTLSISLRFHYDVRTMFDRLITVCQVFVCTCLCACLFNNSQGALNPCKSDASDLVLTGDSAQD